MPEAAHRFHSPFDLRNRCKSASAFASRSVSPNPASASAHSPASASSHPATTHRSATPGLTPSAGLPSEYSPFPPAIRQFLSPGPAIAQMTVRLAAPPIANSASANRISSPPHLPLPTPSASPPPLVPAHTLLPVPTPS